MEDRYMVVIQVSNAVGRHRPAGYRLTFEVTRLQTGFKKWLLLSREYLAETL